MLCGLSFLTTVSKPMTNFSHPFYNRNQAFVLVLNLIFPIPKMLIISFPPSLYVKKLFILQGGEMLLVETMMTKSLPFPSTTQ